MFRLSVPSKTFVVGEYLALKGGPALLLNTTPRFSLLASESSTGSYQSLSSQKVMSDLVARLGLGRYRLEFQDPHAGRGGFGVSGAEVYLLVILRTLLSQKTIDPFEILGEVEKFKKEIGWTLGSGYDVLSMHLGMMASVERKSEQLEVMGWPFANLGWMILRGPQKIPTHGHLNTLNMNQFGELEIAARATVDALRKSNDMEFIEGVSFYSRELRKLGLVHDSVVKVVDVLSRLEGVVAVKGCGALGSDTQLVIYQRDKEDTVMAKIAENHEILQCILSPGLNVEKSL